MDVIKQEHSKEVKRKKYSVFSATVTLEWSGLVSRRLNCPCAAVLSRLGGNTNY